MIDIVIGMLFGGVVGALIGGKYRGRAKAGALWGAFLGAIGWVVVALGPDLRTKCPSCGDPVTGGQYKCRICGTDLDWDDGDVAISAIAQ